MEKKKGKLATGFQKYFSLLVLWQNVVVLSKFAVIIFLGAIYCILHLRCTVGGAFLIDR